MVINKITRAAVNQFANDPDINAIYPTPLGLIYCALKLNGEAGELAEHVGKLQGSGDNR